MPHTVKITSIEPLTHDVLRFVTEKPGGLDFVPGQAVDVSIDKPGWEEELRPFTFTSLPGDDHLEFTIKTYPSHEGVTNQLRSLEKGDELILGEVFGDIAYKGGGVFLAGGAGITPFIAIFKQLEKEGEIGDNKLIFANKTKDDIILEEKFEALLGKNFINVLSEENNENYEQGHITAGLIEKHANGNAGLYYLCGPEPMMEAVEKDLYSLGIEENQIVKEAF